VPNYTFIASATSILEAGAIPVFVDVENDTYNIDMDNVEDVISDKTTAIMPVHFAGRPANMDKVLAIAKKHKLKIIEDAAQAWGSEWAGTPVGAIGDAGAFSFQSSKNINAGEGGIILTNDELLDKMARAHSNCGRSQDGEWYEHYFFGGNVRMTEFQGVILLAQLARYEELKSIRNKNDDYLNQKLSEIDGINPLINDSRITSRSSHLYIFRYEAGKFNGVPKTRFIDTLRKEGIPCSPGYSLPLNAQPVFLKKAFGPHGKSVDLPIDYATVSSPVTEKACHEEAVWFTQNTLLGTEDDMNDIIEAVIKIKENIAEL
jgi:dTDP-4-amino-4,6-dideoxygalactose transaminase